MSGPASSSACSSSPCGGMHNTCGRSAIPYSSEHAAGSGAAVANTEPGEE